MNHDLTTKEGREAAYAEINEGLLSAIKECGVTMSDLAVCQVYERSVLFSLKETNQFRKDKGYTLAFGSDITVYNFQGKKPEINFPCSGSFDPSDSVSYWRTVQAASMLQNWVAVCFQVQKYCKMVIDLYNKIQQQPC